MLFTQYCLKSSFMYWENLRFFENLTGLVKLLLHSHKKHHSNIIISKFYVSPFNAVNNVPNLWWTCKTAVNIQRIDAWNCCWAEPGAVAGACRLLTRLVETGMWRRCCCHWKRGVTKLSQYLPVRVTSGSISPDSRPGWSPSTPCMHYYSPRTPYLI